MVLALARPSEAWCFPPGGWFHELKTHILVEVVEELLRGVKGFGGWVFLLYQNSLSNILHKNIWKRGKPKKSAKHRRILMPIWFHSLTILPGSAAGAAALKFGSAGSTRVACPTSVPERLELYGEARPKPPTLRRRAPKNTKNPSGGWGRAFWPESGSLISVSKSKRPPPPFGRYLKSEKSAVLTHFSDDFQLFEMERFNVFCGSNAKTQKML